MLANNKLTDKDLLSSSDVYKLLYNDYDIVYLEQTGKKILS